MGAAGAAAPDCRTDCGRREGVRYVRRLLPFGFALIYAVLPFSRRSSLDERRVSGHHGRAAAANVSPCSVHIVLFAIYAADPCSCVIRRAAPSRCCFR